jgi:hypothetical protein
VAHAFGSSTAVSAQASSARTRSPTLTDSIGRGPSAVSIGVPAVKHLVKRPQRPAQLGARPVPSRASLLPTSLMMTARMIVSTTPAAAWARCLPRSSPSLSMAATHEAATWLVGISFSMVPA